MRDQTQTKAVVTVAEMARMVGLSRARFYQLMQAGAFPPPLYDVRSRRPLYPEEAQHVCLQVRRRNCGVDGTPVLFYARGPRTVVEVKPRHTPTKPRGGSNADLIEGLTSLGLATVTADQVGAALNELYPTGTDLMDRSEVLRAVFLHLKRQNPADNVRR